MRDVSEQLLGGGRSQKAHKDIGLNHPGLSLTLPIIRSWNMQPWPLLSGTWKWLKGIFTVLNKLRDVLCGPENKHAHLSPQFLRVRRKSAYPRLGFLLRLCVRVSMYLSHCTCGQCAGYAFEGITARAQANQRLQLQVTTHVGEDAKLNLAATSPYTQPGKSSSVWLQEITRIRRSCK